jgi:hypothetical protein
MIIIVLLKLFELLETHCDGQTYRPTDRPTDIARYRAAIAAKNEFDLNHYIDDYGGVGPYLENSNKKLDMV